MRNLSSHPHVISIFASYEAQSPKVFAMLLQPVATPGSLEMVLETVRTAQTRLTKPDLEQLACWLQQAFVCLAGGLAWIHEKVIRHKDLTPKNILIVQGNIVISDFGIATSHTVVDTRTGGPNQTPPLRYSAPELHREEEKGRKADVFSMGCVFVEIASVIWPPVVKRAPLKEFYKDHIAEICSELQAEAATLLRAYRGLSRDSIAWTCKAIQGCLSENQSDRYSAQEALEWMQVASVRENLCDACGMQFEE